MKRILVPATIVSILILGIFLAFPNLENYFSTLVQQYSSESTLIYTIFSFLILSADFLLPVPSSILMFSNGWLLGFIPGFFLSITANMISTTFGYYLGKSAKNKVNSFYNEEELQKADHFLNTYGEIGLIISRGIPIISEATSFVCGNTAFNFKKFFTANLIGYIPVCALYAYLGSIAVNKDVFLIAVLINLILAASFWFVKDYLLISVNKQKQE